MNNSGNLRSCDNTGEKVVSQFLKTDRVSFHSVSFFDQIIAPLREWQCIEMTRKGKRMWGGEGQGQCHHHPVNLRQELKHEMKQISGPSFRLLSCSLSLTHSLSSLHPSPLLSQWSALSLILHSSFSLSSVSSHSLIPPLTLIFRTSRPIPDRNLLL